VLCEGAIVPVTRPVAQGVEEGCDYMEATRECLNRGHAMRRVRGMIYE